MTDKEKLIDFLESSGYKYKLKRPTEKEILYAVKHFTKKQFDEELEIGEGCGYNFFGVFYFLKGKSVDYAQFE